VEGFFAPGLPPITTANRPRDTSRATRRPYGFWVKLVRAFAANLCGRYLIHQPGRCSGSARSCASAGCRRPEGPSMANGGVAVSRNGSSRQAEDEIRIEWRDWASLYVPICEAAATSLDLRFRTPNSAYPEARSMCGVECRWHTPHAGIQQSSNVRRPPAAGAGTAS
jgi:hypothetical protein